MDYYSIIKKFYVPNTKAFNLLVNHGEQVAKKALKVAQNVLHYDPNLEFIEEASMLHDIGVCFTNAHSIGCEGKNPYLLHGILGRALLENINLQKHALVCERHVGVGITLQDIKAFNLPLPLRDMSPITIEEKIICFADKFFSKNEIEHEKSIEEILNNLEKYGEDKVAKFKAWLKMFRYNEDQK
ncbi:MAG: phosphohydrolase [Desulfobacterales bacterium]|nr:phosphohydrolase [Desulfobacterales bacterium]